MRTSRKFISAILSLVALGLMSVAALAADPGLTYPPTSEVSDQKQGSVLIYNIYTSGATSGNSQNTRINITNTSTSSGAAVHLFFINGSDCSIADSFICLTATQTATFLASDVDPGVSGYVVAVATDSNGCPVAFNWLIGDEYVKFTSGHAANLGAEAFAALYSVNTACDGSTVTTGVNFDGVVGSPGSYNRVPRVLADDNVPSRADGNDTLIIINRIGGNLAVGASTLGTLFGNFYDDSENVVSFSFTGGCQLRNSLSDNFPRLTPRFGTFIPAGRSGWFKTYSLSDIGILGAAINLNPNAGTQANAFNGGHNLHKLTLSATNSYTLPVFPPSCF